ncbi:hypothetical protein O6H91_02G103400 [Diphasiastrum complanatum]|uniref:Uncharacterized protein n=1 Tax=Diphasiastrum complanatum TaxID=34168 RepID=A0ACC2EIN1_DIPCM|nr:hypothetical protein O6H91_02G103400 [Diphasiastrum complanatum]
MKTQSMSSGLLQMKFMQRARMQDEVAKQSEKNELQGDSPQWVMPMKSNTGSQNKCVVIMEGDPKPGALSGRMSFQQFNPSVDRLVEEAEGTHKRRVVAISEAAGRNNGASVTAELVDRQKNGSVYREEPCQTAKGVDSFQDQSTKKLKVGTSQDIPLSAYRGNYKQEDKKVLASDVRFKKPSDQCLGQGRANWRHLSQSTH